MTVVHSFLHCWTVCNRTCLGTRLGFILLSTGSGVGFSERDNERLDCINLFTAMFYLRMLSITRSIHCRITEIRRAVQKTVPQIFSQKLQLQPQ